MRRKFLLLLWCFVLSAADVPARTQSLGVGAKFDELKAGDRTYQSVVVTAVFPDRISISHASGMANISFELLAPELQNQFGFDPDSAAEHRRTEALRMAAAESRKAAEIAAASERARRAREAAEAVTPTPTPVQQVGDPVPAYHGFPLSEILNDAVVATSRCPVYDLSGGDTAFREALNGVGFFDENAGADVATSGRPARNESLRALAENAHPGKVMGHVRAGYILKHLRWKQHQSAPVALPKPLGGSMFGCVMWNDFAALGSKRWRKWWNDASEDLLSEVSNDEPIIPEPYAPTGKTLLMDPFSATDIILSNTDGIMLKAWTLKGRARNGLPLAVVETRDGLFLGGILEKDAFGTAQITWEQALGDKSQPYFLKVKSTKTLQPGSAVFSLYDRDSRTQKRVASSNPRDFLIFPESYAEILKKGAWSLKTNFLVPKGAGFEPLQEVATQSSFLSEIEKKLDRIQLAFDGIEKDRVRFLVTTDLEHREITRSIQKNGAESVTVKPWKNQKEILNAEMDLTSDGAVRFTDGELIYEITMGKFHPELVVYSVEASALKPGN